MKRRVRCRCSGATQRAPGRPLQRSRRRLRKVSGRAMATKRRMADKRPEDRGEAPGRHASKWGLRAGIGIELVEFLDGLEEFVRQADSGRDRKSVEEGKSVPVRVDRGGRRIFKKKTIKRIDIKTLKYD